MDDNPRGTGITYEGPPPVEHWAYRIDNPILPVHQLLEQYENRSGSRSVPPGVWADTPEQRAFREAVLARHLARSKARGRAFGRDLGPTELGPVGASSILMRKDAALAAGRLLTAANLALTEARRTGDPDALRTRSMTPVSGYRDSQKQARLWRAYFTKYYQRTASHRNAMPSGPHGESAQKYMIDGFRIPAKIAAPGYSNHQNGIAIDLQQVRTAGHRILNSSRDAPTAAWRQTWFFKWLTANAATFGFAPYVTEPWHWEYRPAAGVVPIPGKEFEADPTSEFEGDGELEDDEFEDEPPSLVEEDDFGDDPTAPQGEWELEDEQDGIEDVQDELEAERDEFQFGGGEAELDGFADSEDRDASGPEGHVVANDAEWQLEDDEGDTAFSGEWEVPSNDPERLAIDDIAERVSSTLVARATSASQSEIPATRRRAWSSCFTADEVARTVRLYVENDDAGVGDPRGVRVDRCNCIVMLNVGLGQLLGIRKKDWPARGYNRTTMPRRPRRVQMGDLPTRTIGDAMEKLVRAGRARALAPFEFKDSKGGRAGVTEPAVLRSSVRSAILARASRDGCWYAFGLSLMDGFHSVLLLVDKTGSVPRLYWLDQNTRGLGLEVTTTLDDTVTSYTTASWKSVLAEKGKRFRTTLRLWELRKPVT